MNALDNFQKLCPSLKLIEDEKKKAGITPGAMSCYLLLVLFFKNKESYLPCFIFGAPLKFQHGTYIYPCLIDYGKAEKGA